jgi:hypothetical protein
MTPVALFDVAAIMLEGVGDPALGEWREIGGHGVVHLRRRLTADEQQAGNVTDIIDIRGTWEHEKRVNAIRRYLPAPLRQVPTRQMP